MKDTEKNICKNQIDNLKDAAHETAHQYKAFGQHVAQIFRDIKEEELDTEDLGTAYRDIGTAYRNAGHASGLAYKKAAKDIASQYKAFGRHTAQQFRNMSENDE